MKILFNALIGTLLLVSLAVNAHSDLIRSSPQSGAVLSESPEEIELQFDGDVRLAQVMLHAEDGTMLPLDFKMSMHPNSEFTVSIINELNAGTYNVFWVAMGGDSHKISGKFSFEIQK